MGIKISQLFNERRDITVTTPFGPVTLTYAPNAVTPQLMARLQAVSQSERVDEMMKVMEKVFADWDVEGPLEDLDSGAIVVPEGEKIPLTAEMLRLLPSAFTNVLFGAAMDDLVPKSQTTSTNSQTPTSATSSWT